ncbi:MAG: response regulator transcription factor [Deltaproteobacteria bacterium]|nr:response regulator transcription factor [Deltaproteobacteria bacterium]MDA8157654.1 response regulator transcription factor [Deltaproteobacteria bacterium]
MINIVLIDDHFLMVSGLKMIIAGQEDLRVVGTANDAVSAMGIVKEKKPDVIVLDISLPKTNGLDLIIGLKEVSPDSKILILTMYEDRQYVQRALDNGALGYLPKKAVEYDLIYAIKTVAEGELYIHPSLVKDLIGKDKDKNVEEYRKYNGAGEGSAPAGSENALRNLWNNLSPREQEVLIFVAEGFSNKEIGEKLFINDKTVATHRLRGMEKLGYINKSELVDIVFFKLKLIDK